MPLVPTADTVITAFHNVPPFAQGVVRDMRLRWAMEEIGRPYRVEMLDAMNPRTDEYREWQPFGQVPAFADGKVRLFETGAILLYLGEQDERLLPREPQARWEATAWLIAALNSVEPMLMQIVWLDIFQRKQAWSKEARPATVEFAKQRLADVANALGDDEWLTGQFTIADIMMVTVLRNLRHTEILGEYPSLTAYQARGEARPSFQQALADQMAGFDAPVTA